MHTVVSQCNTDAYFRCTIFSIYSTHFVNEVLISFAYHMWVYIYLVHLVQLSQALSDHEGNVE